MSLRLNPLIVAAVALTAILGTLSAQSPQPIVVPAQTAAPVTSAATQATTAASASDAANLQLLLEAEKANAEILQKQEATLKTLDELQKAAEQIRIYTKRS